MVGNPGLVPKRHRVKEEDNKEQEISQPGHRKLNSCPKRAVAKQLPLEAVCQVSIRLKALKRVRLESRDQTAPNIPSKQNRRGLQAQGSGRSLTSGLGDVQDWNCGALEGKVLRKIY